MLFTRLNRAYAWKRRRIDNCFRGGILFELRGEVWLGQNREVDGVDAAPSSLGMG